MPIISRNKMIERIRVAFAAAKPLFISILGIGLPLTLLKMASSLMLVYQGIRLVKSVADAAFLDTLFAAALVGLIALQAALLSKLLLRPGREIFKILCGYIAILILTAFLTYFIIYWLGIVGLIPSDLPQRYRVELAFLYLVVGSILGTWSKPATMILGNLFPLTVVMLLFAVAAFPLHWLLPKPITSAHANYDASPAVAFRHVVFLTIDALSAEHLSLYGNQRETSPHLDRFSRRAKLFDRFYANSNWTTPGTTSLITGELPWTTRAGIPNSSPLHESIETNLLSEAKRRGYAVAAFVANPNAAPARLGIQSWIDATTCRGSSVINAVMVSCLESAGLVDSASIRMSFPSQLMGALPPQIGALIRSGNIHEINDPEFVLSRARKWLTEMRDHSTFLWVHVVPPHDPYFPPEPFLGFFDTRSTLRTLESVTAPAAFSARGQQARLSALAARYDESIRYVDDRIGGFLDWLANDLELKDSLIIITADHGESFRHEYGAHGGPRLPEEVIHIPMMIAGPGVVPGRNADLHQQVDLLPTLAKLFGAEGPIPRKEGTELPLGPAAQSGPPHDVYSMSLEQVAQRGPLTAGSVALIRDRYKYVHYFGALHYPNMPPLHDELYDVVADPHEDHDLRGSRPELEAPMLNAILEQIDRHR